MTALFASIIFVFFGAPIVTAQNLDSQPPRDYRSHLQASPQFMILQAGPVRIQAYGADFTMWYRLTDKWDAGMSIQQVLSVRTGGAALMSAVNIKGRWHLLGGGIPSDHRWTQSGITRIIQTKGLEGGLSMAFSIEQVSFNAGIATRSYSGFGAMLEYEHPYSPTQSIILGAGIARLTNGPNKLIPIRIQGGWQIYFD